MNGTRHEQQPSSASIPDSLTFSDFGGEDAVEDHDGGDYSTRLEELLSDDEGHEEEDVGEEEDEDEDEAVWTYREQLRDVLGPEHEDDEVDEQEVENSSCTPAMDDEARPVDVSSDRAPSVGSVGTLNSHLGLSTPASHFSALSPESPSQISRRRIPSERNRSRLRSVKSSVGPSYGISASLYMAPRAEGSCSAWHADDRLTDRTCCEWVDLFGMDTGDPGVRLQAEFEVRCALQVVGAVTALALSYDHTYVASGHASGHILLFDIQNPKTPARFVPPTTLDAVASGREEGHLAGSRIVSIGFIAGRHTACLGKVLFVEATDTLRILGKYPDEELQDDGTPVPGLNHAHHFVVIIALLTPAKLVIVGLKPTPKTWYRAHREADEDAAPKSRYKGTLAWFPSIASGTIVQPAHQLNGKARTSQPEGMLPMLVYGWVQVLARSEEPQEWEVSKVEVGRIVIQEAGKWTIGGDVLALQWLNVNQIIVLTSVTLEVYDVQTFRMVEHVLFDAWTLVSPLLAHTTNGSVSYTDAITEVSHSMRIYKGKIFLLGQHEVLVGTLLTWADRILSFVENGDFLSAIELTRSYYVGEAPGNRNGLPDKPEELREVVGEKMRELMVASARYAFSEDRMTDATHVTPDGRGVDRTSLFENLVVTSARACLALDDFDFLFEELYSYYDDYGISKIFLERLEPFVLDGRIHYVPPRITQKIVGLHQEHGRPDLAERLIWHIDPDCLDINQAITLCQQYQLYDALIYVYTRALKDYVSPVVELFPLIRSVQRYRKARAEASPTLKQLTNLSVIENTAVHAYKIFPYLGDVLTGLTYPSEEPLPQDEATSAKNDVYKFLFFGRSSVWPEGEGGKLVLTSDEENGVEPTYPYARLLVRFDAEAFLHTLDLAFEDHYLNDENHGVSRLVIVKILVEILSTPDLPQSDRTFINIFIARNVPKYPQFIQMAPSALHNILIGLAEDEDESTREDRQLAAEFLLSTYTPHEGDRILALFEKAGFWRILRTWHRHDKQWSALITAYLNDRDLGESELFDSLGEVLRTASRGKKGGLQADVVDTVSNSLSSLLRGNIAGTAALLDTYVPTLHEEAWKTLQDRPISDQLLYLRELLGSPQAFDEGDPYAHYHRTGPSERVPPPLRQAYISLLCELQSHSVTTELRYFPPDLLDWEQVVKACEDHEVFDAAVWAVDWRGDARAALSKADSFIERLASDLSTFLTKTDRELRMRSIFACRG
ncbi:Golgi CORVET complex core vacuolar protein 8-domain-containing protein [Irpex lacteus]|nr:Golgi CORVET complex core vacuolar protein 8-domain-containing protein [Irpex lacteus]